MVKQILVLALFSPIFMQAAASLASTPSLPFPSFNINPNPNPIPNQQGSCSYTVVITTSCSSSPYTRDLISLSFGDAYGNQVYVPRLPDDPSHERTFERCSADTFQLRGPCAHTVCYAYLYRRGSDGWAPATVQIYNAGYGGGYSKPVTFTYNAFLPSDVWWGFNYCSTVA